MRRVFIYFKRHKCLQCIEAKAQTKEIESGREENIFEKCWLRAHPSFPTMFWKAFFVKVVKTRDCV